MSKPTDYFSAEPEGDFVCPQCHKPVKSNDITCPTCRVDLAWAAAMAERQVLTAMPAAPEAPYKADLLLPRFGEYLLRRSFITEAQLQAALARQREATIRGNALTIGQTLLDMGVVTREQLDATSIEQVRQLQEALQAGNHRLEQRVTERTNALQQALLQLAALSELKSNLVGNFSHSLRSPVVPIRGYSTMLAEGRLGPVTDAQRDALEIILRSVGQLEEVVNEIGQLSSNLKTGVQVQCTVLALPALAERLRAFFTPKAEAARVRLGFDLAPNLPLASADAEKVWWVLFQLFDNALKLLTAGDEIHLAVQTSAGSLRLTVADSGPSLPPTQLDEILRLPPEFISRLTDHRAWALAQAKRIVEAHGTTFKLESRPEQGTVVIFELPAALLE